jgi:hypothetical protein
MSSALAEILEAAMAPDAPANDKPDTETPKPAEKPEAKPENAEQTESAEAATEEQAEEKTEAQEGEPPPADVMRKRWQKIQRTEHKLSKREQELEQRRLAFDAEDASFRADTKALLEGDFETKSRVIQRRFGMDVVDFFDKLSKTVVPGADKQKDELRAELAELRKLITERDQREQQSRGADEAERQFRSGTVEALSDEVQTDEIKSLVELHPNGVQGLADEILTLAKERVTGRWIDPITKQEREPIRNLTVPAMLYDLARYLRTAEGKAYLAQLRGSAAPAAGNGNGAAAKTPIAPVRGKPPGTSVSPSQAVQPSHAERQLTPDEMARERHRLIHQTDALEGLLGPFGEQG